MKQENLYIALQDSVLVKSGTVKLTDVVTLYCSEPELKYQISKLELPVSLDSSKSQAVITALKLIEIISSSFPDISIQTIGATETVIYYSNAPKKSFISKLKAFFLMALAFFGTGYSIMSYNGDVSAKQLLEQLYTLFTGEQNPSTLNLAVGIITYSIGLCGGMIIFFNHGINRKHEDDPTPLQVQLRKYEQEVNSCIVTNSSRHNKSIDVD
ncbi:MAG: stage V sporulation protein AA [Wujia sp.]